MNPQMIMWDPTQLEIDQADAEIAASGAKVLTSTARPTWTA